MSQELFGRKRDPNEYDETTILCNRTTNPKTLIVDGATKTKCETCGHEVWIAPSSKRVLEKMKARVVCDVCGLRPKPGEVLEVQALNNEQRQEIAETLENRKRRN
jgi:hypothetical protein